MKQMNWKTIKSILFILAILTGPHALAQVEVKDSVSKKMSVNTIRTNEMIHHTHLIGEGSQNNRDSLEYLLNIFYYDQFRHFQDPRAPYFMFMSKNGDLAFGVGGQLKMKGYFDWNGSIPSADFSPYDIPIPAVPSDAHNLSATAQGTGLFFTLLGKNRRLGNYMAYFQADFSGYNHRGFRLKKAYFTVGDWTAGYTTSTFEDTKAEPSTVDGAGPNGITSRKNMLVRYTHSFKKHWSVAASLEFPSQSINADGEYTSDANPYIPDLAAFAQYQWNGGDSHLRLSGLLRTLSYRNLVEQKNTNITGWAIQLSSVITPLPSLNVFAIADYGRGHASYTVDLGNGAFDLVPDVTHGKLYAPYSFGYVVGTEYFFTPKVYSNIALSQQIYFPKDTPGDGSSYKYGFYAVANLFWSITPRFEVGGEYLYGMRRNKDGRHKSADRIMVQMMLSF